MSAFNVNPGPHKWNAHGAYGSFKPVGQMQIIGDPAELVVGSNRDEAGNPQNNPVKWNSTVTLAARLFVGLNVGSTPRWKPEDVVQIVKRVRADVPLLVSRILRDKKSKQGASFIVQRGIYEHNDSGEVIDEAAVQIIIIDTWKSPQGTFTRQMVELAETIARELEQAEVVVEIQKNGMTVQTMGVAP